MTHSQQVMATHKTKPDKRYLWTDESEMTLAQWKTKMGDNFTFSGMEDNPETAPRAAIKAKWQDTDDPVKGPAAVKAILKLLLVDMMDNE